MGIVPWRILHCLYFNTPAGAIQQVLIYGVGVRKGFSVCLLLEELENTQSQEPTPWRIILLNLDITRMQETAWSLLSVKPGLYSGPSGDG